MSRRYTPLDHTHLYADELRLLAILGIPRSELETFPAGHYDLGTVVIPHADGGATLVRVELQAAGSHWFAFDLDLPTGKKQRVATSSGSLAEYWPHVKALAEGHVTVEDLK